MKVKVVRNIMPHSWYKDRIGETFEVIRVNEEEKHYVIQEGRVLISFICFDDAEVLNSEERN